MITDNPELASAQQQRMRETMKLTQTKLRNIEETLKRLHAQRNNLSRHHDLFTALQEHSKHLYELNKEFSTMSREANELERFETFEGIMVPFLRMQMLSDEAAGNRRQGNALEQEIASVDNYIYILNVRFAGDIHYSCRIGDGIPLKEIEMPSMILQPIVENAIQHGIHDDHENGKVLLGAERIGPEENETGRECICITVSDNGCGMTSAQLEALMKLSEDRRSWENRGNVPPGSGRRRGKPRAGLRYRLCRYRSGECHGPAGTVL